MNRHADLISLLAVDHHRLDAFGDHGLGDVFAASAGDFHSLAPGNSHLVGQLCRYFNERFRHQLDVHGIVLGPIVVVLSQPVRGTHHVESLFGCAQLVQVRFEFLGDGINRLSGMKRISDRTFDRLVVFRKRAIGEGR